MSILEIVIQRGADQEWPVLLKHSRPGELFAVRSQGTIQITNEDLLASGSMKEYGKKLGEQLFRNDILAMFASALAQARHTKDFLRILLTVEDYNLREIHWERLCAPFDGYWDFLSLRQNTPFSINLPSYSGRPYRLIGRQDLRALLLVSGPEDLDQAYGLDTFDVGRTVGMVRNALGQIPCDVLASVEDAIGKPSVNVLCERLTSGHYTILHIVCHGKYSIGETLLGIPDEDGKPVRSSDLLERLSRLHESIELGGLPHFCFLMSCESADPRTENGFGGLGQRMVRDLGLPAVLAMTEPITMQTANGLASRFYSYLYQHGEIDRALSEALAAEMGRPDVTVPAVFSRLEGKPVFSEELDRELTPKEIEMGLDRLGPLTEERAPVLKDLVQKRASRLRTLAPVSRAGLEQNARIERDQLLAELNQLSEDIAEVSFNALALNSAVTGYDERCPFRGLEVFRSEDRNFFFGRETLVQKLTERLASHPFLAVLGASGSGKSSLVLAGVIPELERREPGFTYAYLTPGNAPVKRLLAELERNTHVNLVMIDQFEELFSLCEDQKERAKFIEMVLALPETSRVVITMRADFWGDCAPYSKLKEAMLAHQELVAPMTVDELRRAIEQQAEAVGLVYEAGLAGTILDDVTKEPGAMPLLQHGLLLLWKRRHGRWLRSSEYRESGGVRKAIANTVDQIYLDLSSIEQGRMQSVMLRLTQLDTESSPGVEHRDTRRRVEINDLIPAGEHRSETVELVRRLADARLVVTGINPLSNKEEVEVAHEALIQHWPRLREWLEGDRIGLRLAEEIRVAARQWRLKPQRDRLIHRGERLDEALALREANHYSFNKDEIDYLNACRKQRDLERRRQRQLTVGAIVVAVVMSVLGIFAMNSSIRAEQNLAVSEQRGTQVAEGAVTVTYALGLSEFNLATAEIRGTQVAEQAATADWERGRAEQAAATAVAEAKINLARSLSSQAQAIFNSNDSRQMLSVLLAVQSMKMFPTWETVNVLKNNTLAYAVPDMNLYPIAAISDSYTGDGKYVVVGGYDKTLRVWDLTSGDEIFHNTLDQATGVVAISFDGKVIASSSQPFSGDSRIRIWDTSSGTEISGLMNMSHEGSVNSIEFSRNGKYLVSGSSDNIARVWNLSSGIEISSMLHDKAVTDVAFSPNGEFVLSGSEDGTARVWLAETGDEISRQVHGGWVSAVAFSPDGELVASAGCEEMSVFGGFECPQQGAVRVWSAQTKEELQRFYSDDVVTSIDFSPDTKYLVSGSLDTTARVWEIGSGSEIARMTHNAGVTSVAFTADGTSVISKNTVSSARIWKIINEKPFLTMAHGGPVWSLAFSADGEQMITGSEDQSARIWNTIAGKEIRKMEHDFIVQSVDYEYMGENVVSAGGDTAKVWSAITGAEVSAKKHENQVDTVAFSQDGNNVVSGGCDQLDGAGTCIRGTARVWEASTGNEISHVTHDGRVQSVAFSPDGQLVVSGSIDKTVKVWETETGKVVFIKTHDARVNSVGFSPEGNYVISVSDDMTGRIWEAKDGKEITTMKHDGTIRSFSFNLDGSLVVLGSCDIRDDFFRTCEQGSARVWNIETGKEISRMIHEDQVNSVRFSPDGQYVVSGSSDNTARVWEVVTGKEVYRMTHNAAVYVVAFSPPDGKYIVSGSADNSVRRWMWRPEDLIDEACARITRNLTQAEWRQYVGDGPYEKTCPNLEEGG